MEMWYRWLNETFSDLLYRRDSRNSSFANNNCTAPFRKQNSSRQSSTLSVETLRTRCGLYLEGTQRGGTGVLLETAQTAVSGKLERFEKIFSVSNM